MNRLYRFIGFGAAANVASLAAITLVYIACPVAGTVCTGVAVVSGILAARELIP